MSVNTPRSRRGYPTVVSFYGGDSYYYSAAKKLAADCERLRLNYHIEEIETNGLEWPDICRLKIRFFRDMKRKFGCILWIDVDNRIRDIPNALRSCRADIAGFIGRREYIRDYDPYRVTRFWIPSILYFGDSKRTTRFLDAMVATEESTDASVTDDWVLHETWTQFPEELNVLLLAPSLIGRENDSELENCSFLLGDSGHVAEYRPRVVQHQPRLDDLGLRGQAVAAASIEAMRTGNRSEASVLAHYAYRCLPDDSDVVVRLSNYLTVNGNAEHADEVLREFSKRHPNSISVREALVRRLARRSDFVEARVTVEQMLTGGDEVMHQRGEALDYELSLDEAAAANGEKSRDRPQVWWSRRPYPGHFSEVLKPWIVDQVLEVTPHFGASNRSLQVGETPLANNTENNIVWGSGVRSEDDRPNPAATYLAVRGPRTRAAIISNGGECEAVYGDPARLLPKVLPTSPPRRRRYYLGLLRGASDLSESLDLDDVHEIDPLGTAPSVIERVVDEILNCHAILTTSLTGMIVAHAYGVPARWCVFGHRAGALLADGADFRDYFDSVGLDHQEPLDLSSHPVLGRALIREVPRLTDLPPLDDEYLAVILRYYGGSTDQS